MNNSNWEVTCWFCRRAYQVTSDYRCPKCQTPVSRAEQSKPWSHMVPRHPAKYSDTLLPIFAGLLEGTKNVLDPFAGTGKLALIRDLGYDGDVYLNELEPEWAHQAPEWAIVTTCDAETLPYPDSFFDAICTSPTYGNRMADHFEAKDDSRRNTYRHTLGRKLTPGNTGRMQWGEKYRDKHQRVWVECKRVLKPNGVFILNISDHIRNGKVMPVTKWHIDCLTDLGFSLTDHILVETPRLRYGANHQVRVKHESVLYFEGKRRVYTDGV